PNRDIAVAISADGCHMYANLVCTESSIPIATTCLAVSVSHTHTLSHTHTHTHTLTKTLEFASCFIVPPFHVLPISTLFLCIVSLISNPYFLYHCSISVSTIRSRLTTVLST